MSGKHAKFRLSFKLQTVFVLIAVIAICSAIVASRLRHASIIRKLESLDVEFVWHDDGDYLLGDIESEIAYTVYLPEFKNLSRADSSRVVELLVALGDLESLVFGCGWDVSMLKDLSSIRTLRIRSDASVQISEFSSLANLEELFLECPEIQEGDELKKLRKLRVLEVDCKHVVDVSFISECKGIETLVLGKCDVTDISSLGSMIHLESLTLRSLQFVKLDKSIHRLKEFTFIDCPVSDLDSFLSNLVDLEVCYLTAPAGEPISIPVLVNNAKLTHLSVINPKELGPLRGSRLEYVRLTECDLNVNDVDILLGIGSLEELVLIEVKITQALVERINAAIPDASVHKSR